MTPAGAGLEPAEPPSQGETDQEGKEERGGQEVVHPVSDGACAAFQRKTAPSARMALMPAAWSRARRDGSACEGHAPRKGNPGRRQVVLYIPRPLRDAPDVHGHHRRGTTGNSRSSTRRTCGRTGPGPCQVPRRCPGQCPPRSPASGLRAAERPCDQGIMRWRAARPPIPLERSARTSGGSRWQACAPGTRRGAAAAVPLSSQAPRCRAGRAGPDGRRRRAEACASSSLAIPMPSLVSW